MESNNLYSKEETYKNKEKDMENIENENKDNQQENTDPTVQRIAEKLLEPLDPPNLYADKGLKFSAISNADSNRNQQSPSPFKFSKREDQNSVLSQKSPFLNAFDLVFFNREIAPSPFLKKSSFTPQKNDFNGFRFHLSSEKKNKGQEIKEKEEKVREMKNSFKIPPKNNSVNKEDKNKENDNDKSNSEGVSSDSNNLMKKKDKFRMKLQKLHIKDKNDRKDKNDKTKSINKDKLPIPNASSNKSPSLSFNKPHPNSIFNKDKMKKYKFFSVGKATKKTNLFNFKKSNKEKNEDKKTEDEYFDIYRKKLLRLKFLLEKQRELFLLMSDLGVKPLIILPPTNNLDLKSLHELGKTLDVSLVPNINFEILKMKSIYEQKLYESNLNEKKNPTNSSIKIETVDISQEDDQDKNMNIEKSNELLKKAPNKKLKIQINNLPQNQTLPKIEYSEVSKSSKNHNILESGLKSSKSDFSFDVPRLNKRSRPSSFGDTPNSKEYEKKEYTKSKAKRKAILSLVQDIESSQVGKSEEDSPVDLRQYKNCIPSKSLLKKCRCVSTKCLKLYCNCFKAGIYCHKECKCVDCHNNESHMNEVVLEGLKKIVKLKDSKKHEQKPQDVSKLGLLQNYNFEETNLFKGCSCFKTKCEFNYCECFKRKAGCTYLCTCVDCANPIGKRKSN